MVEQESSVDSVAVCVEAGALGYSADCLWVVARDHLDRDVLISEVGQNVFCVGPDLVFKFHDR